LPAAEALSYST